MQMKVCKRHLIYAMHAYNLFITDDVAATTRAVMRKEKMQEWLQRQYWMSNIQCWILKWKPF